MDIARFLDDSPITVGDTVHLFVQRDEHDNRHVTAQVDADPEPPGPHNTYRTIQQVSKENNSGARLYFPPNLLGEYDLDVDTELYDNDNPLIFATVFPEDEPGFMLFPLGKLNDVFEYAEDAFVPGLADDGQGNTVSIGPSVDEVAEYPVGRNPSPDAEQGLNEALAEDDLSLPLSAADIGRELGQIASWVGEGTLDILGMATDFGFEVVEWGGQRIAVHYVDPLSARELATEYFGHPWKSPGEEGSGRWHTRTPEAHAIAVQRYHYETGTELIAQKYDQRPPADHPLVDSDVRVEPLCIPLGTVSATGHSQEDPQASAYRAPPVADRRVDQLASAQGLDGDDLRSALTVLANNVDGDTLRELDVLYDADDLAPVRIPAVPKTPQPVDYDDVVVAFVDEGALTDLAEYENIPLETANAIRLIHNVEAEALLSDYRNAETSRPITVRMRRFRDESDADAIVLPGPESGDLDLAE
jgi:hypothetical protein